MKKLFVSIIIPLLFFSSCLSNNLWDAANSPFHGDYPVVLSVYPENESIDVVTDQLPSITFSKKMDKESLITCFKFYSVVDGNNKNEISGELIFDQESKIATFYPENNKLNRNSTYLIELSEEIKDYSGLNLQPDDFNLNYTFSTIDNPRIDLENISPTSNGVPVGINSEIIIPFSENVKIDSNWEVTISGIGSTEAPIIIDKESDLSQKIWSKGNSLLTISNIGFKYGDGESVRKIDVKFENFKAEVDEVEFIPGEYDFSFNIQSSWRDITGQELANENIASINADRPIVLKKSGRNPIIAYKTSDLIRVYEFNLHDDLWEKIGNDIQNVGDGNIDLCEKKGVFYVAYKNSSGQASAAKFVSPGWIELTNDGSTDLSTRQINDIKIISDDKKIYLAYTQVGVVTGGIIKDELYILSGDETLTYLEAQPVVSKNHKSISIAINKKTLYVHYALDNIFAYRTYDLNNGNWMEGEKFGINYGEYNNTYLTFLKDEPFVAYNGLFLEKSCFSFDYLDGDYWIPFPNPNRKVIPASNPNFDLIIDKDMPYFVFVNDDNKVQFTFPGTNNSSWKGIGDAEELEWKIISNNSGDFPSAVFEGDKLMVAYKKTSTSELVIQQQSFKK